MNPEDEVEEDGANIDLDSQRKGCLPACGWSLVDPDKLKPGDLVGVNKDSYLMLDTLPSEYDSRVKAMEVDEKPTEDYNDIGGLEKLAILTWTHLQFEQIQELVEAIVLPMTHKEHFQKLGVRPPKGVLLYGPHSTGKTLMARGCAAQTNATFWKLAGPQLFQFPHPTEEARARILQIHSRQMNVHLDVNFEELARSTDDFNGAQLKAVCVEAGMLALRRDATKDIW
ncbi:regulatory particle triple-A ATPase 5A [Actinidia rufa]|uniref:Regulatory particle triple-A ATPase 5A n=1 Tax=Actinidia rufa TaxID=165716 RepID=A0A7J0G8F3_9ERIC|nr:regulatory particle triple-A ATPase 5A [Actinidia rufa]